MIRGFLFVYESFMFLDFVYLHPFWTRNMPPKGIQKQKTTLKDQ